MRHSRALVAAVRISERREHRRAWACISGACRTGRAVSLVRSAEWFASVVHSIGSRGAHIIYLSLSLSLASTTDHVRNYNPIPRHPTSRYSPAPFFHDTVAPRRRGYDLWQRTRHVDRRRLVCRGNRVKSPPCVV